jgi:hypothetical protein
MVLKGVWQVASSAMLDLGRVLWASLTGHGRQVYRAVEYA